MCTLILLKCHNTSPFYNPELFLLLLRCMNGNVKYVVEKIQVTLCNQSFKISGINIY